MAEFTFNPVQRVEPGQNVILNDNIPCNKGYVLHREESGIVILRGVVNGCGCFARYQVTFNGNIAVPPDGVVGPISVSLALDGEPILTSRAIVTPAAPAEEDPLSTDNYMNVTSTAIITVPRGCCFTVAVENTSAVIDGVASPILVQNANLTVSRIA